MKSLTAFVAFLAALSLHAAVVTPVGSSSQIVIPAAGSAAGANGTFFRSDITVANVSTHDQLVSLQWLPQGTTGSGLAPHTVTVRAGSEFRSADFVADYLKQSGLGAIVITGIVTGGQFDPTAALAVSARIWTPEPGSTGTTSQSFPAIPINSIATPSAVLFGLGGEDNPPNYRVNVGVVNLDPLNDQTYSITGPSIATQSFNVPAMSMQQVTIGGGLSPTIQISVQNTTPLTSRSNRWIAYGSTVDNTTGDAWSELGVPGPATP